MKSLIAFILGPLMSLPALASPLYGICEHWIINSTDDPVEKLLLVERPFLLEIHSHQRGLLAQIQKFPILKGLGIPELSLTFTAPSDGFQTKDVGFYRQSDVPVVEVLDHLSRNSRWVRHFGRPQEYAFDPTSGMVAVFTGNDFQALLPPHRVPGSKSFRLRDDSSTLTLDQHYIFLIDIKNPARIQHVYRLDGFNSPSALARKEALKKFLKVLLSVDSRNPELNAEGSIHPAQSYSPR